MTNNYKRTKNGGHARFARTPHFLIDRTFLALSSFICLQKLKKSRKSIFHVSIFTFFWSFAMLLIFLCIFFFYEMALALGGRTA